MRFIRRRIRGIYALHAIISCFLGISGLTVVKQNTHLPLLVNCAILISFVGVGAVNAIAWWSTRKPSPYRNTWAIVASSLSVAEGVAMLWRSHWVVALTSPGIVSMAVGVAGLAIFSQGGSAAAHQPTAEPAKLRPIAGDRTSPWGQRIFGVLSFALEIFAVFLWSLWAHNHGLVRGRLPWYFSFTLAILITTVLHECGHALAASCFKMRLLSFDAGPLQWRNHQGKWSFKFNWDTIFSLGGAVRAVPTKPSQPKLDDVCMILAGPLANVLTGALLFWLVISMHWAVDNQAWRIIAYAASFSFIGAITNLLPFRTECGGYSDGARILQILTHSPICDHFRAMNAAAAASFTDQPASPSPVNATDAQLKPAALNRHDGAARVADGMTVLATAKFTQQRQVEPLHPVHASLAAIGRQTPPVRWSQPAADCGTWDPVQFLREAWLAQATA